MSSSQSHMASSDILVAFPLSLGSAFILEGRSGPCDPNTMIMTHQKNFLNCKVIILNPDKQSSDKQNRLCVISDRFL